MLEPPSSVAPSITSTTAAPVVTAPKNLVAVDLAAAAIGIAAVAYERGITTRMAIHVEAGAILSDDVDYPGYIVAVGLPLYLDRVFHGVFVEPAVVSVKKPSFFKEDNRRATAPSLLAGYQHAFDFGLCLTGAVGVIPESKDDGAGTRYVPFANLTAGYVF